MVICEARAWYTIHGYSGSGEPRLFGTEALRDKVLSKTLIGKLEDKDVEVAVEPEYSVKPVQYNYVLTGRPDLLLYTGIRDVIVEITATNPYSMGHTYPRLCLYGYMHQAYTGSQPLILALSAHDSSITVINDCSGLGLKRMLWRIDKLCRVELGLVKHTFNTSYCRVCRFKKVCIYSRI